MSRAHRPAGEMFAAGWLSPNAAADALGITVRQLEARARKGDIKRREMAPHTGLFLYDVASARGTN